MFSIRWLHPLRLPCVLNGRNMGSSRDRDSGYELIRIVAMLLIVMGHARTHGDWISVSSFAKCVADLFAFGGGLGVNLFALLSGWFLASGSFSAKRVFRVVLQVAFYSILIGFFSLCSGRASISSLPTIFFPIIFGEYWFATAYVGASVLWPFVKSGFDALGARRRGVCICVLGVLFSVIPTVFQTSFVSSGIIWIIYLWLIAYCMKNDEHSILLKLDFRFALASLILIELSVILFDCIGLVSALDFFYAHSTILKAMYSIPMLVLSIALFNSLRNRKVRHSRVINSLAESSFGVYLIHDNPYIRTYIWSNLLSPGMLSSFGQISPLYLIPAAAVAVYCVCYVIDRIRRFAFERPVMALADRMGASGVFRYIDEFMNLYPE